MFFHLNGRGDPAGLFGADDQYDAEDVSGGLGRRSHEVGPNQQNPQLFLTRLPNLIGKQ